MGKATRERPKRLAEKLLAVREKLGLSQNEMVRKMGLDDAVPRDYISKYERGTLQPSLIVLLAYAKAAAGGDAGAAGYLEIFVDDSLEMPKRLPSIAQLPHTKLTAIRINDRE